MTRPKTAAMQAPAPPRYKTWAARLNAAKEVPRHEPEAPPGMRVPPRAIWDADAAKDAAAWPKSPLFEHMGAMDRQTIEAMTDDTPGEFTPALNAVHPYLNTLGSRFVDCIEDGDKAGAIRTNEMIRYVVNHAGGPAAVRTAIRVYIRARHPAPGTY